MVAVVAEEGRTVNANQSAPTIVKLARLDLVTVNAEISEADVVKIKAANPWNAGRPMPVTPQQAEEQAAATPSPPTERLVPNGARLARFGQE